LGKKLLRVLEREANEMGITTLLANISLSNQSLRFHRKNGVTKCGTFRKGGKRFGEDFEVVWMQKSLKNSRPAKRKLEES